MSAVFPTVTSLYAPSAMLADGWAKDVLVEIDAAGWIQRIETDVAPGDAERTAGPLFPGMPNLHGHAFQRAMAGLAEHASAPEDSFWTWREVMYRFVDRLGPAEAKAIASQLYVEMLEAGYTAAAEFHYLHHAPDGRPYDDPAEMGRRVAAAAIEVGMGLTLLPVLYAQGGFGAQAPGRAQRRFLNDIDSFQKIVEVLHEDGATDPNRATGIAPHSLRAVTEGQLREAVEALNRLDAAAPIHIHVAEQLQEVRDCLLWSGRRPVRWLLDRFEVDRRWCLVHATHIDSGECRDLAASGAVAGLCPTTEANLGDGLFPALDYQRLGGTWGIGSDSHISVSPWEELRLLEYGQRLAHQRRNLLRPAEGGSLGGNLYRQALAGGSQACGRPIGVLAPGRRADFLVLDDAAPALWNREGDALLDAAIFGGFPLPVRDVAVGGRWVVRDGRHPQRDAVAEGYRSALRRLLA